MISIPFVSGRRVRGPHAPTREPLRLLQQRSRNLAEKRLLTVDRVELRDKRHGAEEAPEDDAARDDGLQQVLEGRRHRRLCGKWVRQRGGRRHRDGRHQLLSCPARALRGQRRAAGLL